jgi:hypothetical protein
MAAAHRCLSFKLLLGLESLFGCQDGSRLGRVDKVRKLIAFFREVVLDVAGWLVLVEPPLPVIVPFPTLR